MASLCTQGGPEAHAVQESCKASIQPILCTLSDGSVWWVDPESGELLADATPKIFRQLRRSAFSEALGQGLTPGYSMSLEGDTVLIEGKALDFAPGEGKQERYRFLHQLTARPENQYLALAKRDGEYVCLAGAAFHAPSRWDTHTMAHKSHQTRKRARRALSAVRKSLSGRIHRESLRLLQGRPCRRGATGFSLLTLSMPRETFQTALPEKIQRINTAFGLFRRRKIWKPILGAIKGVEAVVHSRDEQLDPYHVHIHLLILSPYLDKEAIAAEWADCLGVDRAIVDIRRIRYRPRFEDDCSPEAALIEVTKYLTKGSDLAHFDEDGCLIALPEDQLLELEDVARWPRQFELLGIFGRQEKPASPVSAEGGHTLLDTASLSVGGQEGEKKELPQDSDESDPEDGKVTAAKQARAPSLRLLMDTLSFQAWCREALARANGAGRFLLDRLTMEKGWTLWLFPESTPLIPPQKQRQFA